MNENEEPEVPQVPEGGGEVPKSNSAVQKGTQQAKEKLRKRIVNAIKNGTAKQSLLAALGPILLWAFVIIVILIIIIGIAMFLVTMPGMVMEKLKELSKAVGNYVSAFFGADTTEQIDEIEVYGTLDYLEQMGWDLKGEGFLTDYMTESDVSDVKANLEDADSATLDEKTGVVRNENDQILKANSDFIFKYMVSDNYVYTIKNNNLATRGEAEGFFQNLFGIITTGIYKIRNFFFGPIYDVLGINEALYGRFGVGLLAIREEDGDIGAEGNLVNTGTIWNWDSIKINTENKTLSIAKNSILSTLKAAVSGQDLFNNPMEFNLDGWTGRYGMPLEFLLAIHKSTMMPDLAYDMVENFGTEVNILLHDIDGSAIATYKGANGYIGFDTLNETLNGMEGSNFFSAVISWFDNLSITQKEAQLAFKLGVEHSPDCSCEKGTIEVYTYDGKEVIEKEGKYYYKDGEEEKEVSKDDLETTASQSDEYVKICSECEEYIQTLMSVLQSNTNYDYQAYAPYISSVKDHWYRDVYFVINKDNLKFVDYDYDYQIMTGERWTLYETDENGDFVYYKLNDDGSTGEKYKGKVVEGEVEYVKGEKSETLRIASIGEDGTKVVKKAVTINANNTNKLLDLGWNKNSSGIWSAYEEVDGETSTMDPLFPDIEDDGSYEAIIKKNCYMNLTTSGNIAQTGEGQRTETNTDIKKMFLQNYYFRYDGTASTAEIITALREKIYGSSKDRYGPIKENKLNKEYTLNFDDAKYTSEAQNGTYKVSDYVGNVTLNQDSLNAFTMLENTHTLDADYIYRDFKELVVELGYFKKEELTDETPRLLQWIVPDIGSSGYPDVLDKRENEYGTMVHSKSDIDVNKKHTITEIVGKSNAENGPSLIEDDLNANRRNSVNNVNGVIDGKSQDNITNLVGSATEFKKDTLIETATACWQYIVDSGKYTYAGASIPITSGTTVDCSSYVSWILYEYGFEEFAGGQHCTQDFYNTNWTETMGWEEIAVGPGEDCSSQIKPGDLFVRDDGGNNGHIQFILSVESDGTILTYDCGDSSHWVAANRDGYASNFTKSDSKNRPGKIIRIEDAQISSAGDPYEGYEGNEAVVSPVTGILLDYGTYEKNTTQEPTSPQGDDETSGKVVTEDPRVNVDLKYGFTNIYENSSETEDENSGGNQQNDDTGFESQIVSDKVGYAKILVLDAENYQKLESATKNRWNTDKYDDTSLVRIDQTTAKLEDTAQVTSNRVSFREVLDGSRNKTGKDDDYSGEYEDWSAVDKTIYGYKEFAETYEKYGIAGYVVYIDGFKCELPDESLSGGEDSDDEGSDGSNIAEQIPQGKKLTKESFKQTESQINEEQEDEDSLIKSKYEGDEAYKLASEKSTNKLSAEVDLKAKAAASISTNDLIFIKEGTVIGRTLTDKELLESADFRNGEYGTYEELRGEMKDKAGSGTGEDDEEQDDNLKLIGNYLRIIMKDEDGKTVENVENYMKLDQGEDGFASVDQEYKAWPGDLEALAETMFHESAYSYLASYSNKFATDQKEADFEMYCMGYSVVNKVLEQNKQWYGHLYDESRTDMSPLFQVVTNARARWYGFDTSHVVNKMKCYTEKELEYAEFCLTYDCTSVTKPYDTPLSSATVSDGYTKTTQGTVIPRAMCQQGGYGDGAAGQSGIILVSNWDHNNNNQFDKGDELWGVDRAMEGLLAQDNVTQGN